MCGYFRFVCKQLCVINKSEALVDWRKEHDGADPVRRPLARLLNASKSDALRPWTTARVAANHVSGIVIAFLDGMDQLRSIPEIFAIEEQYQAGLSRAMGMTCEQARGSGMVYQCVFTYKGGAVCKKTCQRKADYKKHYRTHLNLRPYKCRMNTCDGEECESTRR